MEMNEKKIMDLINCDSEDKEKMVEAVNAKLRWYTFEASEEEFDPEAVDMLVKFLREIESELGKSPDAEEVKIEPAQEPQKDNTKGKIVRFGWGKIAAAIIIGVLALTVAGTSLGTSQAWEDGGFFHWIRQDKKGQTMVTSPEDLRMEDGKVELYYELSKVPAEYHQYLVEPLDIEGLEEVDITLVRIQKAQAFLNINETLLVGSDESVECGITIFEDEVRVVRDSYDELEYQYSIKNEEYILKIYAKDNTNGRIDYTIVNYDSNKKIFVTGQLELEDLVDIAKDYVRKILNK